jgi:uncharacterized protein YdaU (DUF1376 family)
MKDPAFLFYPNDYIGGTMGMTFEEKGAYMELLMMQFNQGHMTCHMIGQVVGRIWDKISHKFMLDADGRYYNERLETEIKKRQNFVVSRKNNISGINQYTDKNRSYERSHDQKMTSHMENENVNENVNKDIDKNVVRNAKSKYGSEHNVLLTREEIEKLRLDFPDEADDAIEFLSQYIAEKGYKAKCHNLTIRRWVIHAVQEKREKEQNHHPISEAERIMNIVKQHHEVSKNEL